MIENLRQQLRTLPEGLCTRFAPSPTGYLHLGHVASAIFVWGIAKAIKANVLIRLEDHDRQRCRPEYASAIIEDLAWLGFVSEKTAVQTFDSVQSKHDERYQEALGKLKNRARVYACSCSRKAISERNVTKADADTPELLYDAFCRKEQLSEIDNGMRVQLGIKCYQFKDLYQGTQQQCPAEQCGDLLVRDRHGNWTYNFCVVVDDAVEGVNFVIRGLDILPATGRQLQLAEMLDLPSPLYYLHHPLIWEKSGQKLSKRYGSTALRAYRDQGYTAAEVLGMAAHGVGLLTREEALSPTALGSLFI